MRNKKKSKDKNNEKKGVNGFQNAVENTPEIANAYCSGLQAFREYSKKIQLTSTLSCEGSVDIDASVIQLHPQTNRWDYCFSYRGEVFFVEVHSANTGEVDVVLRKLQWLKDWLHGRAPRINALKAKNTHPYYWIQSNGFHILKNSPQYRRVIQAGIKPIAFLKLD